VEGSTSDQSGRGMESLDNDEGIADGLTSFVCPYEEQAILGWQRDEVHEYAGEIFYRSIRPA